MKEKLFLSCQNLSWEGREKKKLHCQLYQVKIFFVVHHLSELVSL